MGDVMSKLVSMGAMNLRRTLTVSAAAAVVITFGCATNPVTGKRELSLISEAQEVQMGREASQAAVRHVGEVN